jgi:hypothetical protein
MEPVGMGHFAAFGGSIANALRSGKPYLVPYGAATMGWFLI